MHFKSSRRFNSSRYSASEYAKKGFRVKSHFKTLITSLFLSFDRLEKIYVTTTYSTCVKSHFNQFFIAFFAMTLYRRLLRRLDFFSFEMQLWMWYCTKSLKSVVIVFISNVLIHFLSSLEYTPRRLKSILFYFDNFKFTENNTKFISCSIR